MINLTTWARLPLVLGFPAFTKPLLAMKHAVEEMEGKLARIKCQIGVVANDPSLDYTVLKSYETEMELIYRQTIDYRKRIIASSVKFATAKIREAITNLAPDSESSTPQRRRKFTIICRALLKKISLELHRGANLEREPLVELADVLGEGLRLMQRADATDMSSMMTSCPAVTVSLNCLQ
jgi:hypothetical protein